MSLRVHALRGKEREGGALLVSIAAVTVLAGMAAAMLTLSTASQRENRTAVDRVQALYVAEAGLSSAIAALESGAPLANFGTAAAPVDFGDTGFWGTSVDNGDGTQTITSFGTAEGVTRGLQVVMTSSGGSAPFTNALFAGNSSLDPNYTLEFGGCGAEADQINGSVYSGNDIDIDCDASITGAIVAAGAINGAGGTTGTTQAIPDINGMNYAVNHDINVSAEFGAAAYTWDDAGGTAWQVGAASPAHIFRMNPSDRTSATSTTNKDDYFLEDPYEPVNKDIGSTGTDPFMVTLAGNGNDKVYYIDGNLWIHNYPTFSFQLDTANGDPVQVTFVVEGNVYFGDNIFYGDPAADGIAFIAIKDPNEADSGNIYFGDPSAGTLEYMDSFMYAENNFYDNNLTQAGSGIVEVNGNMSAGNQVLINRQLGTFHAKLDVDLDIRLQDGSLSLPGLPKSAAGAGGGTWQVTSWHEVPAP